MKTRPLAAVVGTTLALMAGILTATPSPPAAANAGESVTVSGGCPPYQAGTNSSGSVAFTFAAVPIGDQVNLEYTVNPAGSSGSTGPQRLSGAINSDPETLYSGGYPAGTIETVTLTWTSSGGGGGGVQPTNVVIPSNCGSVIPTPTGSFVGMAAATGGIGYWLATDQGYVLPYGTDSNLGILGGQHLNSPIVDMAATPDGGGYWLLGQDGGVFTFGDANFYGSTGSIQLNKPVVGMAPTADGGGYWFVASDGGVFSYGDARFYGSMGGKPLNAPIVGMAPDFATGGYWLVASDGGIFSFNAPFRGSTGNIVLNKPVVGMEAAPDGSGYRFVASDGGIFCFGVPFSGAMGGQALTRPIVGMTPYGSSGYWMVASDGGVFNFGGAPFYGSGA